MLGSTVRISGGLPPHWVTREGEERFQPCPRTAFHTSQRGCGSAGTSQCDVGPAAPAPRGRNGARPAPAPSDPLEVSMRRAGRLHGMRPSTSSSPGLADESFQGRTQSGEPTRKAPEGTVSPGSAGNNGNTNGPHTSGPSRVLRDASFRRSARRGGGASGGKTNSVRGGASCPGGSVARLGIPSPRTWRALCARGLLSGLLGGRHAQRPLDRRIKPSLCRSCSGAGRAAAGGAEARRAAVMDYRRLLMSRVVPGQFDDADSSDR